MNATQTKFEVNVFEKFGLAVVTRNDLARTFDSRAEAEVYLESTGLRGNIFERNIPTEAENDFVESALDECDY